MTCVADLRQNLIDVYFDNGELCRLWALHVACTFANTVAVGGEVLDMALGRAKPHARFVMCGGMANALFDLSGS